MCMLDLFCLHLISPIFSLILFNFLIFYLMLLDFLISIFFVSHLFSTVLIFFHLNHGFIYFFHFFLEFCQFTFHLLLLFHHLFPKLLRLFFVLLLSGDYCIIAYFWNSWWNICVKIFICSMMTFTGSSSVICFSCFLLPLFF